MAGLAAFRQQVDIVKSQLTGEARRQLLIETAQQARAEAERINRSVLGYTPAHQTVVDGRQGAAETSVRPGGTIIYLFEVGAVSLMTAVDEAAKMIVDLSPFDRGAFRDSNMIMVNGVRVAWSVEGLPDYLKPEDQVTLTNLQPYARRIERGWSKQAPNGVYEVVYSAIKARYGRVLNISFGWDAYPGHEVGQARRGGKPEKASDKRRAAAYPTIRFAVK